ncbi:hypothetical protein OB905_03680 [Halobacteria archaeon AArc-dxtr1]|nr:hypothetical protein [Halobacteria archaeon AArc-dxtr1]
MNTEKLAPIYAAGIALNVIALGYSIWAGELLFALTFGFVLVYLGFRYRMIRTDSVAPD